MIITETDIADIIVGEYDQHVRSAGESVTFSESREAILPAIMCAIARTPRDIEGEAKARIRQVLDKTRSGRAQILKHELDWITGAMADPETIGWDQVMQLAFPLGRFDGSDKTLCNWTRDDLIHASRTRFQIAAEQTAAAAEFDTSAQQVIDLLDTSAAHRIGDLR